MEHVAKFSEVRGAVQEALPEPCRVALLAARDGGEQPFLVLTHISDGLLKVFVNEVILETSPPPLNVRYTC